MDALFIFILVSTFTPDPVNILSSATSSRFGVYKALPFMIGALVGTYIVFVLTGFFNILYLNDISFIEKIIGYIGAVYMCYLAYRIIASTDNFEDKKEPISQHLVILGIILSFGNPKAILFGLTVSGFYFESGMDFEYILVFSLFLAVLYFISVLVWGIFGFLFMKFLSEYQKIFNMILASLLIYSALIILIDIV